MSKKVKRSESPWFAEFDASGTGRLPGHFVRRDHREGDCRSHVIAFVPRRSGKLNVQRSRADAEFIVRACNSHDELLGACRAARESLDRFCFCEHDDDGADDCAICIVNAAIAKAEAN